MGTEPPSDPASRQPVRLLEWRDEDDGTVTVLRPKYGTGRFGRWLSGRLARPHCAVRLDEYGSFVWKQCDGSRTMQEIANSLQEHSPDAAIDLHSRLAIFVRRLERTGLIGWGDAQGVMVAAADRSTMNGSVDVLGIGVAVRDIAVELDTFPESDRKYQARGLLETGGGPVPTALVTLARLGRRCAFIGVVGDDAAGRFILEGLNRESVDVDGVVVREGFRSPTSIVLVERAGGQRTILECSQYDLPLDLDDLDLDRLELASCRYLLVDARLVEIQLEVARRLRRGGGRVVLDCGHPRRGVDELLALTDVAILSHTYPRTLHGEDYDPRTFLVELHQRLRADGPRIAGLTLGADGCAVHTAESGFVRIPGHAVAARDTTGAGDVFHGAFVHACLDGGSPLEAARFANAAAALKCEGLTGRSPLPPEDEILRFAAARG